MLRSRPTLFTIAGAILLVVIFGNLHGTAHYVSVIQNAGHSPAFAILAFVLIELLRGTWADSTLRRSASVILIVLFLGIGTEGVQALLGRDADPLDVEHDLVGAAFAVSIWVGSRVGSGARVFSGVVAFACFGIWLQPLVLCAYAYWHRVQQWPTIAEFKSNRDLYFTETPPPELGAEIVPLESRYARFADEKALQVPLRHGRWPGVTFDEPVPDWSHFSTFHVEITNPMPHAVTMGVRVNDLRHTFQYEDRYTGSFPCQAETRCTFDIPIKDIAHAPRTRLMNLGEISMIIVFHDGPVADDRILINRLWLE